MQYIVFLSVPALVKFFLHNFLSEREMVFISAPVSTSTVMDLVPCFVII